MTKKFSKNTNSEKKFSRKKKLERREKFRFGECIEGTTQRNLGPDGSDAPSTLPRRITCSYLCFHGLDAGGVPGEVTVHLNGVVDRAHVRIDPVQAWIGNKRKFRDQLSLPSSFHSPPPPPPPLPSPMSGILPQTYGSGESASITLCFRHSWWLRWNSVCRNGRVNSVKVEIKFHLEHKLRCPCAQFKLREMHRTNQ